MAVFLLIRHADNNTVGESIAGRLPGIHLNAHGRRQAESLAERLAGTPLDGVFSSPLERTRETAATIAGRQRVEVEICPGLLEIDYGEWAGVRFCDLESDPRWRQFNTFRSGTRVPGGELMVEVQARMVGEMEELRRRYPHGTLALVSHGDPIKTAIAHYAGFPLDLMRRFEISLASVSVLEINDHGPQIVSINSLEGVLR
ncbi:MAG: histidine phosphatase family protein [Desulfuromonadales bacterium]|nr:histidine phosphatase family protein [Desulfuromonadales bacterium]